VNTNVNIHLHGLVLDGMYRSRGEGVTIFHPAPVLTGEKLQALLGKIMSPLEFMQRLAALVPRLHLIRFHGAVAPNAKLRAAIVPIHAQTTTGHAGDCKHAHGASARMSWARLLKRVYGIDVERCECGGKLKIIAAIEEPAVIERILTHLGLSAQPPPRAPARRVKLFQAA
jgi:hypothetical protein